ncbi:MAG: VacJ family lipoprotein [Candidatus Nanoarchaeia archaeon]
MSSFASDIEHISDRAKPIRIYYWLEPTPQTEFKLESSSFYYYSEGLQKFLENCDTSPVYSNETLNDIVGVPESIEGFNRVMFEFNDFFLIWIMRPLMKGYSFIIPKTGRKGISNIAKNVEFPVRTFSCFLQGRFADGGIDFSRFLINTILGGAGAYDAAKEWFDMEEIDEDFGQAFASWGCGPGCYLTLPIHGPTTLRDGIGLIFDYGFDPKTWVPIPGVQAFCKMNEGSLDIDEYRRFTRATLDPYANIRDYWYIMRQIKVEK